MFARFVLGALALVLMLHASAAGTTDASPYVLPFTSVLPLHARANGVDYRIYVRVPPEYASTQKSYPVIYLLDADYSFALATQIVEHLSGRMQQAPQAIIVGVAYADQYPDQDRYHLNRTRDYTPVFVPDGGYGPAFQKVSGGGPKFLTALRDEIMPLVERTYRADPHDRTLVGHSYGGLFASWVLQQHPELFHRYLIVSPSLWYNKEMILAREVSGHLPLLHDRTLVYLAIGSWENHADGDMMIDQMNRFATQLDARHDPNLAERHRTFEDETHASIFPTAFSTGIRHLFGDMETTPAVGGD